MAMPQERHPMTRRVLRRDLLRGGATLAAGAALAACGGQQEGPAVKQSGPVTGPIELMWSNEQSTIDFLNAEWIPSFKKENPQADVTMTIVPGSWDDLYQKIQVTNAAGTPPSLSRGKDYFTGDMAALGIPEPLDKWLKGQKEVTPDQ